MLNFSAKAILSYNFIGTQTKNIHTIHILTVKINFGN